MGIKSRLRKERKKALAHQASINLSKAGSFDICIDVIFDSKLYRVSAEDIVIDGPELDEEICRAKNLGLDLSHAPYCFMGFSVVNKGFGCVLIGNDSIPDHSWFKPIDDNDIDLLAFVHSADMGLTLMELYQKIRKCPYRIKPLPPGMSGIEQICLLAAEKKNVSFIKLTI